MFHAATPKSCHNRPSVRQCSEEAPRKRPFLCVPYVAGKNGRYEPSQSINRCPEAAAGELCKLSKHSFRKRKTGPEIPLRILQCNPHSRHFTVYPLGHVPYGRSSLAAVDLRGETIECTEPEPEASCRDVVFEAALDASRGQRWESEPIDDFERPRYPTQRRHIERCGQLLGLDRRLAQPVVEKIRDHLGIGGLDHELARARFQTTKSLEARGTAILDVHQQVVHQSSPVWRLLAAGFLSGLWGHPWLWDAARGQRFSLLSRTSRALRAPP